MFRVSDTSSRNYVYTNRYIYDDSDDKYANARVIFNFTSWLHFAISEFYNIPISTNLSYMFKYPYSYMVASAGELTLDFYPLVFKGEYLHGYPNNYVYSRSNLSDYSEGWYAQFGYTLLDKYVLLLKWGIIYGAVIIMLAIIVIH